MSERPSRRSRHRLLSVAAALLVTCALAACEPAASPSTMVIDLRVLVVDDGSPMVAAIVDALDTEGVPHTDVVLSDTNRPVIDGAFLSSGSEAHFQAVVLPNETGGGLAPAEMTALGQFESTFSIRQVDAYTWAHPAVGLDNASPNFDGDLDGVTATVTDAGKANGFGYLNGPVPFGAGSYANVAPGLTGSALPPGSDFTTLVSAPIPANGTTGSIIGVYRSGKSEQLVITAAFAPTFTQWRALAHGVVTWATRGVHLGENRNYFSVQVDDIFNSDSLWDSEHHCTPGEDCPRDANGNSIYPEVDARMTPSDVDSLVAWQNAHDFSLQMVFNGGVAADDDPLTQRFLADKADFWWINHTYTHEFLGCVQDFTVIPWVCVTNPSTTLTEWEPESLTTTQIQQNIDWANAHQLPFDPSELVSGDYSGLKIPGTQADDNPNFVAGIAATGIKWLAADVSRGEFTPRNVGGATTTPRYPINIFYNAETAAQEVSEYNWLYTSVADGGSGYCTTHPETTTCIAPLDPTTGFADYIVPLQAQLRMPDILHNDPRSIMVHATNLSGEQIILPVIDSILEQYRAMMSPSAPLVNPKPSETGTTLLRQGAWAHSWSSAPGSTSSVRATLQNGVVHVDGPVGTEVPITVPEGTILQGAGTFGEAYGGERSDWVTLGAGGLTLAIPAGTSANPLPPAPATDATFSTPVAGSTTVAWTAPADTGRPTDLVVTATADGHPSATAVATRGTTSTVLTGLDPGVDYEVLVYSVSSAGISQPTRATDPSSISTTSSTTTSAATTTTTTTTHPSQAACTSLFGLLLWLARLLGLCS